MFSSDLCKAVVRLRIQHEARGPSGPQIGRIVGIGRAGVDISCRVLSGTRTISEYESGVGREGIESFTGPEEKASSGSEHWF